MDPDDAHSATVSSEAASAFDVRYFHGVPDGHEDRNLNDLLHDFRTNCESLERQLELFARSVRQLGSSLGLYKGSREFQQQLSSVRRLLEDESQIQLLVNNSSNLTTTPHAPSAETWVHQDLWKLVNAISIFSIAWDDFPEFADSDRKHCLVELEQHLLVWLNILGSYESSPEFLRCVRELLFHTIFELAHVDRRLADFVATGVQEISFAQNHSTQILFNSATIATFFSAVTVTTIQYSFTSVTRPLMIAVNTLWFSSLVLSVSSAINSLLAMTWKQAIYSTPQRRVQWWVRIWFKQTPIILLAMSVLSFLAGLICFVLSTQHPITQIVVSTLTGIVAIGLGAITVWFGWERWDFSRLRRKLWLQETQEKLESSWGMLAYGYVAGIIWRSAPTSLPTRSSSRSRGIPSTKESRMVHQRFTGSNVSAKRKAPRAIDNDVVTPETPSVQYSDELFPQFSLHKSLRLGQSEDTVRHVRFSPKGTWFAACTKSVCYIYQVKPRMSVHQALKHPFGQIRQLEWSPDEKRLLMRVSGGIELWETKQNNKFENRQKEWMGRVIKKVQWIDSTTFLVLTDDNLLEFKIRDDGHLHQDRTISFEIGLYTFAVVPTRNCVLVIAGHRSRVHEEVSIRFPKRTLRSVMNYNLATGDLLHSFPLLRDARWINVASDGVHILFGFSNQQARTKTKFTSSTDSPRIPPNFLALLIS
ncbi:hypothetical protein C8F04DRAFT_1099916 [Mycena alexandri]|uniref:WD40 repeat-like protein n=1 Tax=Mycena alexandri TaxID=1745969 RepID=A0AAD6X156_9AGAR|nr:hypothetical protein C8F04DRAFT_1099916 [Mycena alexandri]